MRGGAGRPFLRTGGRLAPQAFVGFATALVAVASAIALVTAYGVGASLIMDGERRQLLAERDLLVEVAREEGGDAVASAVARRARYATSGERYGLFDARGRALAGDLPRLDPAVRSAAGREVRTPAGRLLVVGASLPGGEVLIAARDLSAIHRFARAVLRGFVVAVAIVAAAGFAAALVLNALILRRVDAIAATARRIADGDLSARTPLSDPHDPFGRVAASLNAMLNRIEELMTGMRTVTDSLAHDLRSPLTRMEGALARALHPEAGEEERLDAIEAAHGEVGRTLATLSALLDIARAETGLSREMMRPVDLTALLAEMAEVFAPAIEDAGQAMTIRPSEEAVTAVAHEPLLRQAVGNLLHNASVHAGPGASVIVGGDREGDRVRIVVADTGRGVPDAQRGRVQERFVRLDPARGGGGSGLGLAIVAACAKLHGGSLELSDNAPGLRAVLVINDAARSRTA